MGKNTFGKTMPRALSQNLKIMGEQIMLARKRRHLSMQDIADRATVTRLTVSKVEHGDPTVSMGIYARVLFALNLENDITLLAADDALGRQLQASGCRITQKMKRITVYADFDFLTSPEEIGTLGYENIRGKDHFVFEYSHQWLKQHGGILLSGDLLNVPSLQHPRGNDNVFSFVKDSFPDRWGRLLLDRRERLTAQQEGRPKRMLTNYDYLIGIEDFTRMGGIRYKEEDSDGYINASAKFLVPPIESLCALCDACHEIELAEERNELPEQRWLDQLINPGTSLGGARPKANVVDTDGKLYVAKFPSKKDLENTELIEHFSHQLAAKAGINVAKTRTIKISKDRDLLLSESWMYRCAPESPRTLSQSGIQRHVWQHRRPLPQSRFPAYPERLDALSCIRHQSRSEVTSMLAYRLIH